MLKLKSDCAVTGVITTAELLKTFGSASGALTLALFVIEGTAAACGVMTMVTVAVAPFASEPRSHLSIPEDTPQAPWLGVAETMVTFAGRVSRIRTRSVFAAVILG